ncbi:MAG: prolyl oligopeptidase family serine peptidase, partial [Bifidobacterium sp.]|nr:prolyl oligopeptidase family serine peptidase [Bifidobacterium sp.]
LDGDWDAAADDADGQARAYADAPASSSGDPSLDPPQLRALGGSAGRLYSIGSGGNPSYDAPRMRYSFTSYTRPGELHEFDPATGDDRLLKRAKVRGGYDPTQYVERRVWVDARDGERVPVSLVYRRDAVAAGPMTDTADGMPMFATGYGAYEISSDPSFSVGRLSMLDRGVLYAVPHIRGGGEMGRAWYEHGRRLEKRHTFEDFVDAVAALQDCGFADRTRTVADGGSAGGLLMGAVANLAPERFAGIEADVPFVDALTTMLDPSLPLTVTEWDEWGDPLHDPDAYEYMRDYSPYENAPMGGADARPTAAGQALREEEGDGDRYAEGATGANPDAKAGRPVPHPGDAADHAMPEPAGGDRALASHAVWRDGEAVTVYPHIFVTTSMHDTRVLVVEPLKWVARLQAAGLDALIRVETDGGHGGGSGRYKQWRELCYENAWCLAQMRATELLHVR